MTILTDALPFVIKLAMCQSGGIILDIIPKVVMNSGSEDLKMKIDEDYVTKLIPKRQQDGNKSSFGRAFIVTGSKGMTGSGCLAAESALRTGAGLVYLGVPSSLTDIYEVNLKESITISLKDTGFGTLDCESKNDILNIIDKCDVTALGPGLSSDKNISEIVFEVIKKAKIPLILDADALNVISEDVNILRLLKVPAILTPHPGEMARLLNVTVEKIQADRIKTAKEFACKYKVIVVLKGYETIVALPDGNEYINPTGNSGMATAGTGDVLTGVITGLVAQGATCEEAAVAGVYIHGLAGDLAKEDKGEYGMIAGDVVEKIPYAIKSIV